MFTKAIAKLSEAEDYADPRLIEVLREVLGNCAQELESRGDTILPGVEFLAQPDYRLDSSRDPETGELIVGPTINIDENTTINLPSTTILRGAIYKGTADGGASEANGEWTVSVGRIVVHCNPTGGKTPAIDSGDPIIYGYTADGTAHWLNNFQEYEADVPPSTS